MSWRRALWICCLPMACASAPTSPIGDASDPAVAGWEGFFEFPNVYDRLDGFGVSRQAVESLRPRIVRLILASGARTEQTALVEHAENHYCSREDDRAWNEARCEGLAARTCADGECTYEAFGSCSGILIGPERVVTAAHCVAGLDHEPQRLARSHLLSPRAPGATPARHAFEVLRLGKTDFAHHWVTENSDAADVALLRVPGLDAVPMRPARLPRRGAVVFMLGYPRVDRRYDVHFRHARHPPYRRVPGRLAASFGRLDDANSDRKPFCSVDGTQEGWRLSSRCPHLPPSPKTELWRGVISTENFTTTMDTINGYSGAPVFDARGRWIGVNSTVSGGVDPQDGYAPALRAVVTRATAAMQRLEP